jgi:hypothetical protein
MYKPGKNLTVTFYVTQAFTFDLQGMDMGVNNIPDDRNCPSGRRSAIFGASFLFAKSFCNIKKH